MIPNQFIYYHSKKNGTPVKDALMNEAYDSGMLPVKTPYHYAVVEIEDGDITNRYVKTHDFKESQKDLVKFIKGSKSADLILLNYIPFNREKTDPLVTIENEEYSIGYSLI